MENETIKVLCAILAAIGIVGGIYSNNIEASIWAGAFLSSLLNWN